LSSKIDEETNQLYDGFFPDYYLKILSFTYNIFYESCVYDFNVKNLKNFFDGNVDAFNDIKMQRFLLTLISID
jgi:hypothetical protein